jgi:hypothetical protein
MMMLDRDVIDILRHILVHIGCLVFVVVNGG